MESIKPIRMLDRTLITGPQIAVCFNAAEWCVVCANFGLTNYEFPGDTSTVHFELPGGGLLVVVCFDLDELALLPSFTVVGVIVHEANHVWQRYRAYIGEHAPSKEFEAYAVESLAVNLLTAYASGKAQ